MISVMNSWFCGQVRAGFQLPTFLSQISGMVLFFGMTSSWGMQQVLVVVLLCPRVLYLRIQFLSSRAVRQIMYLLILIIYVQPDCLYISSPIITQIAPVDFLI